MSSIQLEHDVLEEVDLNHAPLSQQPWELVVWDDPVNLMNYVSFVFRSYFNYSHNQAEKLMLQVHNNGSAVVAQGPQELVEIHAQAMHDYGLWATIRKAKP